MRKTEKRNAQNSQVAKNIRKRELLLFGIGILIAGAAIFFCWRFFGDISGIKIKDDVFTFVDGEKISYTAPIKLSYTKNDKILLSKDGASYPIYSNPLYKSDSRAILTNSFLTADYSAGQLMRIPRFSEIKYAGGEAYLCVGKKQKEIPASFLFDGEDTYIFLTETEIICGDEKFTLPPMSFAIVIYDRKAQLINPQTGETAVLQINGNSITAKQSGAVIDLNLDFLTSPSSKEQILPQDVSFLPEIP